MNKKIQDSCKTSEELKAYVDKNIAQLKDFVGEIVKKLPTPYLFTAEGIVRRTLTLHFECGLNEQNCLYTRDKPFTTDTSDWAKWVKMSFTLFKLGKALYDKSLGDAFGAAKDLFDQYKQKEDGDFMSYISQPFLTSTEQDNLINQLRDKRFFDVFVYSAQHGAWACARCGRKEEVGRAIESGTMEQKQVPKTASAFLKVSVGLLQRVTKVWCIVDSDTLAMFPKEEGRKPTKEKPPGKTKHSLNRSEIVHIKDADVRVVKRDYAFYIITKSRTYTVAAPNKELLDLWKLILTPQV